MKKFHVYFIKQFLKLAFFILFFVVILNIVANTSMHTKLMAKHNISFISLLIFEAIELPSAIYESMPMALAITTMATIIMMIRSNELLAYVSLGGRLRDLLFPMLGIGVVVFAVLMFMADRINPWVENTRKKYETEQFDRQPYVTKGKLTDVWMKDGEEGFVHMELVDPINREFFDVTFYRMDDSFEIDRVTSIKDARPRGDKWELTDIKVYDIKPRPELIHVFDNNTVESRLFSDLADLPVNKPKFLSLGELSKIIKVLKKQKLNAAAYELMVFKSYGHAVSAVIIMFLVFPVCVNFSRHSSYILSAVNALALAVAYWLSVSSFQSLGKTGVMSPLTVSIIPNVLFLAVAIFLVYRRETAS